MCLHPIKINVATYEKDDDYILVPCGKCIECRASRARSWQFRLAEEAQTSPKKFFITLTYDDEHLPKDYSLHKEDTQKFWKRFRKSYDGSFKYFLCGEYGDLFGRPHYHALVFFHSNIDIVDFFHLLKKSWKLGNILIATITLESIAYVTKYMVKQWLKDWREKPFQLMSRRPAIGSEFLDWQKERYFNEMEGMISYRDLRDRDQALPRYYKNKCLTPETKEAKFLEFKEFLNRKYNEDLSKTPEEIYYANEYRNYMGKLKEFKSKKRK